VLPVLGGIGLDRRVGHEREETIVLRFHGNEFVEKFGHEERLRA
jgi:hypothetical protein